MSLATERKPFVSLNQYFRIVQHHAEYVKKSSMCDWKCKGYLGRWTVNLACITIGPGCRDYRCYCYTEAMGVLVTPSDLHSIRSPSVQSTSIRLSSSLGSCRLVAQNPCPSWSILDFVLVGLSALDCKLLDLSFMLSCRGKRENSDPDSAGCGFETEFTT